MTDEIHLVCDSCGTAKTDTVYFVNQHEDIIYCFEDGMRQAPEMLAGMRIMYRLPHGREAYQMFRWVANIIIEDIEGKVGP